MAGRIPQQFIDDLIARVDIVELIGHRIALKRSGDNFLARCPFHDEKTPSFTVSRSKQFYHCFGCEAHGTAIGFLMQYEQLDFVAAVETLAGSLGLEVPREGAADVPDDGREALYPLLEACRDYYLRALREHPQAVRYLKQRGLSGEIARDFVIGYAPPGWDNLERALGAGARDGLQRAGMLIERDQGGCYDRFRDRIMFPIRDTRARVVGFGGRALGDATPKYMNSPESPAFHKRREVYGLHEVHVAGREQLPLVVVEGYMDVVALHQQGLRRAVASLGTAVTEQQVQRMFRESPELVFCFDGDAAGRRAAWRALETSLPMLRDGREVRFLFLPESDDPDSFVRREGAEAFRARMADALPLSDYLLLTLRSRTATDSIGGRARLAELARPLLRKLPRGIYAELLTEQLARTIGSTPQRLESVLGDGGRTPPAAHPRAAHGGPPSRMTPLRLVIALLLRHPGLHEELHEHGALLESEQPGIPLLRRMLGQIAEARAPSAALLLERLREDPESGTLARLAAWEPPGELDEERARETLRDALARLEQTRRRLRGDALLALARERELSGAEKAELNDILKTSK